MSEQKTNPLLKNEWLVVDELRRHFPPVLIGTIIEYSRITYTKQFIAMVDELNRGRRCKACKKAKLPWLGSRDILCWFCRAMIPSIQGPMPFLALLARDWQEQKRRGRKREQKRR